MKTNKPSLLAVTGFYVAADAAYMPTQMDTDAGYFISKEPVLRFNAFEVSELAEALRKSLFKPNEVIAAEHMPPKDLVMSPHLHVSTQQDLERKTVFVSVVRLDTGFRIESQPRKADGTWDRKADRDIDCYLPLDTSYEKLAETVIAYLRSRRDLPGQAIDINQQRTARGA